MSKAMTLAELRAVKAEAAKAATLAAEAVFSKHGFQTSVLPATKPDQTWGQIALRGAPDGFSSFIVIRVAEKV